MTRPTSKGHSFGFVHIEYPQFVRGSHCLSISASDLILPSVPSRRLPGGEKPVTPPIQRIEVPQNRIVLKRLDDTHRDPFAAPPSVYSLLLTSAGRPCWEALASCQIIRNPGEAAAEFYFYEEPEVEDVIFAWGNAIGVFMMVTPVKESRGCYQVQLVAPAGHTQSACWFCNVLKGVGAELQWGSVPPSVRLLDDITEVMSRCGAITDWKKFFAAR